MWRSLRRAWREFWCKHYNCCKAWADGEGWTIKVCSRCGRAIIYTECDETHNPHKTVLG